MDEVEKIERRLEVLAEEMWRNNKAVHGFTERARQIHAEKMELMATLQRLTA